MQTPTSHVHFNLQWIPNMALALWRKKLLRCYFAGWELSLSLAPILSLLLALPLLIKLGVWQLDRAAQRQQALHAVEQIRSEPPVAASDPRLLELGSPYVHTELQGDLDWSRQFLLDNQVHNTVAGFEVLTPIVFESGRAILLSRGWIPPTLRGKPDLSPPETGPLENTTLKGLAVVPPPRLTAVQKTINAKKAADPADAQWPIVIVEEDFAKMSEQLGLELVPRVLQPESIDFGYAQIWQPVRRGPLLNYGYAVQWFAMALLLLGGVIYFNLRRSEPTTRAPENSS